LARAAGTSQPTRGTVVIAFVVEQLFTQRGLLTVGRNLGPFSTAVLLDAGSPPATASRTSPDSAAFSSFETMLLPAHYVGTPVETVSFSDVAALEAGLTVRIRGGQ
jgi:hypothetical protein